MNRSESLATLILYSIFGNHLDLVDRHLPIVTKRITDSENEEIKRLRELTEWREIASAPKGNKWLVVARFDEDGKVTWWEKARWHEKKQLWSYPGGWCKPTHWLPLPEPPQETK